MLIVGQLVFINLVLKLKLGQRDSTEGSIFALHETNVSLIPEPMWSKAHQEWTIRTEPGVSPEHSTNNVLSYFGEIFNEYFSLNLEVSKILYLRYRKLSQTLSEFESSFHCLTVFQGPGRQEGKEVVSKNKIWTWEVGEWASYFLYLGLVPGMLMGPWAQVLVTKIKTNLKG